MLDLIGIKTKITIAAVIILGGWLWYQSYTINSLERDNSNLRTDKVILERDIGVKDIEKKLHTIIQEKKIEVKEKIINEKINTDVGIHTITFD